MLFQVLPLKVLVSRQVVKNRLDYSTFLNGTVKEELDRLDMLAGDFRVGASKLTIDGGKGLSSHDWHDLKKMMPRMATNFIEDKAEFSIVEKMENGMRNWVIYDMGGDEWDLMSAAGCWEETTHFWIHRESFFEDGRLVHFEEKSEMYNGEYRLCMYLYHSFAIDQQDNLVRRYICSFPQFGVKVTKDMWALRKEEAQNNSATAAAGRRWQAAELERCWRREERAHTLASALSTVKNNSGLEKSKVSEEGDVHINATLASLRKAVRNGLLNNANTNRRKMKQRV